jgi:hypothetical protein
MAYEVLDKVLAAGGSIIPDPARPRLLVPSSLEPLVREYRAEIRQLLAYRDVLRRAYGLIAQGEAADPAEIAAVLQEQTKLVDETGPAAAQAVGKRAAHEWWQESGRCPWCGELGEYHAQRENRE